MLCFDSYAARGASIILEPPLSSAEGSHNSRYWDCVCFESLPNPPNHVHFLPTETCVLDRHAEKYVFVLLVVAGKSVLMEQHEFRVIRDGDGNPIDLPAVLLDIVTDGH
jgi:hypothetical protein